MTVNIVSVVLVVLLPLICCRTRLANYIMMLDQNITEVLLNPTVDQGEPLLYVLDEYITRLRDVNHLLKFNPKFMYKTAKCLHQERAPQFLEQSYDLKQLHRVFQWEDFKTEAIDDYLKDIKNYTFSFRDSFLKLNAYEFDKYDYESNE